MAPLMANIPHHQPDLHHYYLPEQWEGLLAQIVDQIYQNTHYSYSFQL